MHLRRLPVMQQFLALLHYKKVFFDLFGDCYDHQSCFKIPLEIIWKMVQFLTKLNDYLM